MHGHLLVCSTLSMCCVVQALAPCCGADLTLKMLLPALAKLARDQVPNVRFNVALALEKLFPVFERRYVRPCILGMDLVLFPAMQRDYAKLCAHPDKHVERRRL